MEILNDTSQIIYRFDGVSDTSVYINSFSDLENVSDKLNWHKEFVYSLGTLEKLTLQDIYTQIKELYTQKDRCPIITLFIEDPLKTEIYQCNNYEEGRWVCLGKIDGYA